MGERWENAQKMLVGRPEGTTNTRWEENMRTDLRETGWLGIGTSGRLS
jgi:hypothetical protein